MDIGDVSGDVWSVTPTAVSAAIDLWEILLDTSTVGNGGRLAGLDIFQTTELGDAAMEFIPIKLMYGNTTSGSGGPAIVAAPTGHQSGVDPFANLEALNTTTASGGSPIDELYFAWGVLQPLGLWLPAGREWPLYFNSGSGERSVLRFLNAPADSVTLGSSVYTMKGMV